MIDRLRISQHNLKKPIKIYLKQDCERDFHGLVSIQVSEKSEFELNSYLKINISKRH